jgi:hypothetical protein
MSEPEGLPPAWLVSIRIKSTGEKRFAKARAFNAEDAKKAVEIRFDKYQKEGVEAIHASKL